MGLTAILSLAIGYGVFRFVQWMVAGLWTDIPANAFGGQAPWYYLLILPVVAGVIVALLRRGADGHNPLGGLSTEPVTARDYPFVLASILATLAGGLVLGPEVALISTGSVIGWIIGTRTPGADVNRTALIGAFSALAALAIEPIEYGGINIGDGYSLTWQGLLWAVVAAVATAVLLSIVRLIARGIVHVRGGDRPIIWHLALGGLVVGLGAWGFQTWAGEPVDLVLTSGEQLILPMIQLESVGLIAAAVGVKALAYAVSMGAGFRGGPYFPAMYAGAGIGAMVAFAADLSPQGPALAGLTAGVLFLAKPKWLVSIALSAVIGLIFGGPVMILVAVVGGIAGRAMPRLVEAPPEKADDAELDASADTKASETS